jgi:hypothetical protein
MAAPLFRDEEIAALIRVRKYVEVDAAHSRKVDREGIPSGFVAHSDEYPEAEFVFHLARNHDGCNLILSVRMGDGRPSQAICRYDIQDGAHLNRDGSQIMPREPHSHIYKEESVRETGQWDSDAAAIPGIIKTCAKLYSQFLVDMHIHFSDSQSQRLSFGEVE